MKKEFSHGFTLIEVMITLAIAAIVLSIGVPSFQSYIRNNYKTTAINDLRTALALTRSTAITRRERATVCKSTDNATCAANGDWSQGWIVFTDPNNPGTVDPGETILRVHNAISGSGTFSGNANVTNRVSFTPQGLASGSVGTITYADGADFTGSLVISFGGQVRSE